MDSSPDRRVTRATVQRFLERIPHNLGAPAITRMVGEGAIALLTRAFTAEHRVARWSLAHWRVEYDRLAPSHTRPMPGAPALLDAIRSAGMRVGLCTNKPHAATLPLLDAHRMDHRFDAVWAREQPLPTSQALGICSPSSTRSKRRHPGRGSLEIRPQTRPQAPRQHPHRVALPRIQPRAVDTLPAQAHLPDLMHSLEASA